MSDEVKQRTIDQLHDVPYSEITDAEIESVIEFRAQSKADDAAFAERMEACMTAQLANVASWKAIADKAESYLDEIAERSRSRLKEVQNGTQA